MLYIRIGVRGSKWSDVSQRNKLSAVGFLHFGIAIGVEIRTNLVDIWRTTAKHSKLFQLTECNRRAERKLKQNETEIRAGVLIAFCQRSILYYTKN